METDTASIAGKPYEPAPELAPLPGSAGVYDAYVPRASAAPYQGTDLAADLMRQLFQGYPGSVAVRLWNGAGFIVGRDSAVSKPPFVLVLRSPETVSSLILGRDPLRFAEAYFRSGIDIEGDMFAALGLKDHLADLNIAGWQRLSVVFKALRLRSLNARDAPWSEENTPSRAGPVSSHSREQNRAAIRFHYDVSNDFYRLWLGASMVYSCGYFEGSGRSMDEAQFAKLEHICRKLLLRPNETFLDIGCGWGTLLIHAASEYGVRAHGVTLSRPQLDFARRRIAALGLQDRVTVELKDYRDLAAESFDKVASVGMFEHVGLKNLPVYFSTVNRVLAPGGLFLNHGITHDRAGWHENVSTQFINRYVFPDGQLDNVSNIQRRMEDAHFEIEDVESLRSHYALTLRCWVGELERRHDQALDYVNEATYRVWRLYMTAAALDFEAGTIGIYQILAAKRGASERRLPLTRRHLYSHGEA